MIERIEQLCAAFGPAGRETSVRDQIVKACAGHKVAIREDAMGNLIVHHAGAGAKIALMTHMDESALMITAVTPGGYLRVASLGHLPAAAAFGEEVLVDGAHTGLLCTDGEVKGEAKITDAFIDLGLSSDTHAEQKEIGTGSLATFAPFWRQEGERIMAKALPRSVACAILLRTLEALADEDIDLSLVFTVQNEVGSRGASAALFEGDYDVCIEVGAIEANDIPGGKGTLCLGSGPVIKVMDKGVLAHPLVLKAFKRAAVNDEMDHQLSVSTENVSDLAAAHVRAGSMMVGGLCVACRYPQSRRAVMHVGDIEHTARLLTLALGAKELRGGKE